MAASHALVTPPDFDESKMTWREYKKEIEVWSSLTNLAKEKQGPALWMALKGKAKEAVKEMEISEIKENDGLTKMMEKLDIVFKTDDNQAAYLAYRDFESFVRPPHMKLQDFVIMFESNNSHIKRHKMILPDGVLAYRFLHSANLKEDELKLCRATIADFTYEEMKRKILSLFGDKVHSHGDEMTVKTEPVFYGHQTSNKSYNSNWNDQNRPHDSKFNDQHRPYDSKFNDHNRSYDSKFNDQSRKSSGRGWNKSGQKRGGSDQGRFHGGREHFATQRATNPLGPNGRPSQCKICSSIYHWVRNCPEIQEQQHSKSNNVAFVQQKGDNNEISEQDDINISLFQDTRDDSLKWFLGETIGCAVVDSGCSKTVAGSKWVKCFLESLNGEEVEKIHTKDSNETFKFGKGEPIQSSGKIVIPVQFGKQKVTIESDIVEADIPLLLSKEALKKAGTILDFNNDTALMFGEKQTLIATESGHYAIPLSITKEQDAVQQQISLIINTSESIQKNDLIVPFKIALKLHRQFCHCSAEKLTKLIKASNLWKEDETSDIVKEVKNVTENCDICKKYKRSPPTPIVSCSLSSHFNETVAMDLIEIKGKYVLHLIDMFSRYSAACSRNTKGQEAITDGILKIWITYFGKPAKFLADNGGEFANETYIDMCTTFSIEIMKTSAESPWSNGLAERHNGVLKLSILKTVEESGCSLDTAVAWSISAKNTLGNNLGYSANTIVFGRNPSFPSVISDNITALTAEDLSRIVEENLYAMRAAREAYIEAESSEKIKRALTHNIRTSCEEHYEQGDKVFFKRNDSKRWYGPGTVIGQDGKQILVRNGSQMVRVHVTRITHVGKELQKDTNYTNSDSINVNRDDSQLNIEHVTDDFVTDCTTEEIIESEMEQNQITEEECLKDIDTADTDNVIKKLSTTDKTVHPKVRTYIRYKLNNDENWRKGYVHSRAGKLHGKYESHFNIQNDDVDSEIKSYDFDKNVQEWEPVPNEILITTQDKNAIMTAKQQEIENWKKNDVFEEAQYADQNLITTRWVITTKEKDSVITTKARLVARGFEDEGVDKGKTDSPTCSRESLSLIQSLLAMKKWKCQAIDIKTAFLQGNPLEREVYLKPPKEFQSDNRVWKLKKAVYGLNEASRAWYDRVEKEFKKVGLTKCKYDEALFYFKTDEGKLLGAMAIHVDDFIYGGCQVFLEMIEEIKDVFEIGTETSTPMKFLGMNITQSEDCTISFHQNDYLNDLNTERNKLKGDKYRNLTTEEQREFRGMVGQLNWVASRTNPIIAFDVCQLSTKLSQATVEDYHYAMKVTKKASNGSTLHYCSLESPVFLLAYSDASYANLPDGGSQGGYVVFLANESERVSPITWTSRKLRRVCRSTITAETMATLDAIDVCAWLFHMFREVFDVEIRPTVIRTDNKSAYQAINSTTAVEEKRLRVDIAAIRECVRNNEVSIEWVSKENQLADVLTKQGADSTKLMKVLRECHI